MTWHEAAYWSAGAVAVLWLAYLFRRFILINGKSKLEVPGLAPSSKQGGNFEDIAKAGSLHEFLVKLHKEFGPIASFWWGTQHATSIASPELFKQHQDLFDRSVEQFSMMEPLITSHSIQCANGSDGRARREAFDKVFNYDSLGMYYEGLQKVADEITVKLDAAGPEDHLPLGEIMFLYSVKAALIALMGDQFKNDQEALAFKQSYDVAWEDMERRLTVQGPIDETRQKHFDEAISTLRKIIGNAVKEREASGEGSRDFLLIDAIIGHHADEDKRYADAVTYTVGGFHTTANLLTWCVYFMCMHEEVQDKVYEEIRSVLGPNGNVSHQTLGRLKYLRQVLDETLRCGVVAPYAARFSDNDIELGGYKVPAKVPIIHALGVSMLDDKVWKQPDRFNPDRFSAEGSKGRPTIAFSPFGFAGRRQCPGYRFAYMEASVLLVTALQKVKFLLVPGQDVHMKHGLVTHPRDEIWVKVIKRTSG